MLPDLSQMLVRKETILDIKALSMRERLIHFENVLGFVEFHRCIVAAIVELKRKSAVPPAIKLVSD